MAQLTIAPVADHRSRATDQRRVGQFRWQQYATGLRAGVRWAILGLGAPAAVIGVTSTTWLAHPDQRLRRTAGYRVAEIVSILLVSRGVSWLAEGQLPSVDAFLTHPDEVFFDGPYLLTLIALLFTWFAVIDFTDDPRNWR